MNVGDRVEILITRWYHDKTGLPMVLAGEVLEATPRSIKLMGGGLLRQPPMKDDGTIPCRLCGRALTEEASRSIGYGPDCMVQLGLTNKLVRDLNRALTRDEIETAERHLKLKQPIWIPRSQIASWRRPGDAVLEEALLRRQREAVERALVVQRAADVATSMRHEEVSDAPLPLALPFECEPRPYQWRAVRWMLELAKRGGVSPTSWDKPGTGKTIMAILFLMLASADLAVRGKRGPCVVVCPPVVAMTWKRTIEQWWQGARVQLLKGYEPKKKLDPRADVYILSWSILAKGYEPLRDHQGNVVYRDVKQKDGTLKHQVVTDPNRVILSGNLREVINHSPVIAIIDEAHNAKEPAAQRSQALAQLALVVEYAIPMTGTAVLNRTSELVTQLDLAGVLDAEFGGRARFETEFAGKRLAFVPGSRRKRWVYDQITGSKLVELHRRLTPYVIRRRTEDVISDMPKLTVARVDIEISNRAEYDRLEDEVYQLPPPLRMGQLAKLRQVLGIGKLEAAQAWIKEFLENEEKLIVFANHQSIQLGLVDTFKPWSPAVILGRALGSTDKKRQEAMDRFQADDDCLLAILSAGAAREGITLTAAANVLDIELEWTPGIQDQKWARSHRYGQEHPVTVWVLAAPQTMDDTLMEKLASKRRLSGEILDGKAEVLSEDVIKQAIIGDLVRRVARRKKRSAA